jgi:tRNA(Ile)-lysidine synthase
LYSLEVLFVTGHGFADCVRRCYGRLSGGGGIGVVAVSGGPDSVALLRALLECTSSPLVIAHLNHQLRGAESDGDEAFVRDLHRELRGTGANLLPLRCDRIDVAAAAVGDNLESVARRIRYEWLTKVASEVGAAWVATGHTADDQAETVLHRILRGTGLKGLAGIPARRDLAPGIALIRPMLAVRRPEVLDYLRDLRQSFRDDSSNVDPRFTRNRLRHELLPLLAADYNPAVIDILGRLAEQAGEVEAFVGKAAADLLAKAELPRAGVFVVLAANHLTAAPFFLAAEAVRKLWEREAWPSGEMTFEDWKRVIEVAAGARTAVDLPGGVRARRVGQVMQLVREG